MSRAFNGSSQSASRAIDFSAYSVLSVGALVYVNSLGANDQVLWELTSDSLSTAGGIGCVIETTASISLFTGGVGGGFPNAQAVLYSPPSTGTWLHIGATYDRSLNPSRQLNLWLNGVVQTPTSTPALNSSTGNYANDTLYIGSRANSAKWFGGNLAQFGIWNQSLGSADWLQLAAGLSPLKVRPSTLIRAWPFDNGLIELRNGGTLTNNGTTSTTASPRIYR